MKKIALLIILIYGSLSTQAKEYDRQILLTGASFAVAENGWFEILSEAFDARPLNKAVSAEAIYHTAIRMYNGTFYTEEELRHTDLFVIMHVHNQNVANPANIKENYQDYALTDISNQYHTAYDYVIKRYMADCQKIDKEPCIVLCTHWHDSRTTYNEAIRKLAAKWNFPLIKWDEKIGFTKKVLDPDGSQPSLKYATDDETIYGVKFGWHPMRGKGQYIQKKMAWIAMEELEKIFFPIPVSVTLHEKTKIAAQDEPGKFFLSFTGVPPWNCTYSVNGQSYKVEQIEQTPLMVSVPCTDHLMEINPLSVSNNTQDNGTVFGKAMIYKETQTILSSFDTYVHQANPTLSYQSDTLLQVKGNTTTHSREFIVTFPLGQVESQTERIIFRAYYYSCLYPDNKKIQETHPLPISGNNQTYTAVTWNTRPTDFAPIGEVFVEPSELLSYIDWDISDFVAQEIAKGSQNITLRIQLGAGHASGLLHFYSSRSVSPFHPQLLTSRILTGVNTSSATNPPVLYFNPSAGICNLFGIERHSTLHLYALNGEEIQYPISLSAGDSSLTFPHLTPGIYIAQIRSEKGSSSHKIIQP